MSATHVGTGKVRVFENPEMSLDMPLDSACLRFMFREVEIGARRTETVATWETLRFLPLFAQATGERDLFLIISLTGSTARRSWARPMPSSATSEMQPPCCGGPTILGACIQP
jgi:hypothetical protein